MLLFAPGGLGLGTYAAVAVGTAAGGITAGAALAVASATILAAGAVVGAALSAAVDWAMPDIPELNQESSARLNKTLNPEEARKIIFGETAAPSDIRYWETYGTDNKQYDEVIAVATHEIESFEDFYMETDLLTFDGSGNNLEQYGSNFNKKDRTDRKSVV